VNNFYKFLEITTPPLSVTCPSPSISDAGEIKGIGNPDPLRAVRIKS
jgi:hypothetical protein